MAVILVVDDDADVVEAVSMVLAAEGHQVAAATGAGEALALARALRPVLTLVDWRLPGVDTRGLIAALGAHTRVALCTAADAAADLAHAAGADRVLAKPFAIEELLALVRWAVGEGERQREGEEARER